MGLRQTLNENPVVSSAIVGAIVLVALFMVGRQACGGPDTSGGGTGATKAFFTADEGKTWFVDDASKIPPFDKGGKQAFRAYVFKCANGKEFVNHMEQYPAAEKAKIEAAGGLAKAGMVGALSRQVRRPGEKTWASMQDPARLAKASTPRCPDGGANATLVEPK